MSRRTRRKGRRTRRRRRRGGVTRTARASYRRRRRNSKCRGLIRAKCRHAQGCKMADGRKRHYCRKSKNTRRRRR